MIWRANTLREISGWRDFMYGGRDFISTIWQCERCKYACLDPIVSGEKYYAEADGCVYSELAPARKRYFERVKLQLWSRGVLLSSNSRMLDLGAGTGEWLDEWPEVTTKAATEVHPTYIDILEKKDIKVFARLEESDELCDMITAFDFLEHLEEPSEVLNLISSRLAPGGVAVFGVPNMGSVVARIFGTRYYLYCPMHYSSFTESSLRLLLKSTFSSEPIIFKSPPMQANIGSIAKWLAPAFENSPISKFWIPVGYRASLISIVRKPSG